MCFLFYNMHKTLLSLGEVCSVILNFKKKTFQIEGSGARRSSCVCTSFLTMQIRLDKLALLARNQSLSSDIFYS